MPPPKEKAFPPTKFNLTFNRFFLDPSIVKGVKEFESFIGGCGRLSGGVRKSQSLAPPQDKRTGAYPA